MELRKGFKQTEIGIIPEDWEIKLLDDCLDLLTDFEANGSFEDVAKNVRIYDAENFAWYVRATDLEKGSGLSEVKFVDRASYDFLHKTKLFGNEVLITKRGEIGKVYFYQMKSVHATLAPNMYLLKLNNTVVPYYIYQFFKSKRGHLSLVEKNASTTLGALYKKDVKSIKIPLPPTKAEQIAIGTALRDMDNFIARLEHLIEKKKAVKQGAMQELLRPKAGWLVKKLGDLFEITAGGDLDRANYNNIRDEVYKYPIYSNSLSDCGLYGYSSIYTQCENSITVTARGTIGQANFRDHKYLAIGRVLILKPKKEINCHFISECINRITFANESTGVPQLTAPQISNYEVVIPNYQEQNTISNMSRDMDNEIFMLEENFKKYKLLKQGMMQELLAGKTRLI